MCWIAVQVGARKYIKKKGKRKTNIICCTHILFFIIHAHVSTIYPRSFGLLNNRRTTSHCDMCIHIQYTWPYKTRGQHFFVQTYIFTSGSNFPLGCAFHPRVGKIPWSLHTPMYMYVYKSVHVYIYLIYIHI